MRFVAHASPRVCIYVVSVLGPGVCWSIEAVFSSFSGCALPGDAQRNVVNVFTRGAPLSGAAVKGVFPSLSLNVVMPLRRVRFVTSTFCHKHAWT